MMGQHQRHTHGEPQTRVWLHEGAQVLMDHAYSSQRKQQYPREARVIQRVRSLSYTSTYTDVTLCSRLLPRWHGRMSCSSVLVWILVSLFLLPLQPHGFPDNSQNFGLQPIEAVNPDNVDFKDVQESHPRRHYVRRAWRKHSSEKTEPADDFLIARKTPYVFEAAVPRQQGPDKTHQQSRNESGSASRVEGTAKTCALLVLAHDWPLSPRRGEEPHSEVPFDWSEQWYFLRQELQRRAEFDTLFVIAPDVSSPRRGNDPVVTSLHHYAAYLARQTRLMLQALLQSDPEPEREPRASVAGGRAALAARLSALFPPESLDDVFSVPLPNELVTRWFLEASESPGGSTRTSRSSSVLPFSTSRSGPSSEVSSVHDPIQRHPKGSTRSSVAASSVTGGPQAGSSSSTHSSNVDAGAASGSPSGSSFLYNLLSKSFRTKAKGRTSIKGPDPSHTAGAMASSTGDTRVRITRTRPTDEDTRVIWSSEDDTFSESIEEEAEFTGASSCARIDLFLLGHRVGGLALRLMAASPSSTLWDAAEDERKDEWKREVLRLHLWLSGRLLNSGSARNSANPSTGREPTQREHGWSTGFVPDLTVSKRDTSFLPRESGKRINGSGRYSSGSAQNNISSTSHTTGSSSATLHKSSQSRGFGSSEQVDRSRFHHSSPHYFTKSSRSSTPVDAAAEMPRRGFYGSIVLEETDEEENGDDDDGEYDEGEDDEREDVEGEDELQEGGEDCRATQTETSQRGVRLRTVLLDHTPLAGLGPRKDEPRFTRSRMKVMALKAKWEWSAAREAVRKIFPPRAPPRPSSDLKRALLHLDGPRVLCTLAHEEKQSYTVDKEVKGSLITHFGSVLYYGGLNVSDPAATASQLGIAYPFLMHSVAAHRTQRCNDPKRPCKMIDVAASSVNSPVDPRQAARRTPSPRERAGSVPASQGADSPASPAASLAAGPRERSGLFSFLRRRNNRGSQRRAAPTDAPQDSDSSTPSNGGRKREPHASFGPTQGCTTEEGKSDAVGEQLSIKGAAQGRSRETIASRDTYASLMPQSITYRGKAAAAADSDGPTDGEGLSSEEGYEGEVESDSIDGDYGGGKRPLSYTAKDYTKGSYLISQRSREIHALLFSLDICRMTTRTNLYDVTLVLLEAINQNQHPHAYNPVRFGIWEGIRTGSPGPSKENGMEKDAPHAHMSGRTMLPKGMTEERRRVLLHMAVRFFQEGKSVRRWDFSGDKHIYSKEWFTRGRGPAKAHCSRHAHGLQS